METQAPYNTGTVRKATPQVDALRALQEVLTVEQIQRFADKCRKMKEAGEWGEVGIMFVSGDAKKVYKKVVENF